MSKKITYSETDMAALIGEVEKQFAEHLAKAEKDQGDTLTKSEKTEEKQSLATIEAETKETNESVTKSEESTEKESNDYDDEDLAEMDKLYGSMTKNEAEAHFNSLKKTLSKEESEIKAETVVEKKEEKIEKSEKTGGEASLLKSELENIKKENEELKKSFATLTDSLVKFVKSGKAPKQKAITSIEYIAKSETEVKQPEEIKVDASKLTKVEISKRLTDKIRSGKIEKSEREKINDFYESGSKNIELIKHLL